MSTSCTPGAAGASAESPIFCPAWCDETDCRGEHNAAMSYVPATGGLPSPSKSSGVWFPEIGAAPGWNTIDHQERVVAVHITGEGVDAQADLRLHEAKMLRKELKRAIRALEATA